MTCMEQLTPEFKEIMRLWKVIQRLTQRKGLTMTDKEEAVFGLVYQEFQQPTTSNNDHYTTTQLDMAKAALVRLAAQTMRELYDLEKQ